VCAADQTCQPPGGTTDGGADASPLADASPGIDGCAGCAAPANDLPAGAIDVTAGGDFTADLTNAHDDAQKPSSPGNQCGADGGLDVFYTVHLDTPEVFYFDTFGSDFDTVIRVVRGSACAGGAAPTGTTCRNDACSTAQSQYATSLPAGDSCIIIDGLDGTQAGHSLHLHVERGLIDGSRAPINGSVTGDTTTDSDHGDGTCSMHGANDHGWFFTSCPGQTQNVLATTCNQTSANAGWDLALWARGPAGQLACQDDDGSACPVSGGLATISFTVTDAHLYWIVVDSGSPGNAGAYELDVTFP
jgi:hypothetical protein